MNNDTLPTGSTKGLPRVCNTQRNTFCGGRSRPAV